MKNTEMTVAEIKAMYFNDDSLLVTPWPLYRYTYKGDRYYYYTDPEAGDYDPQDKPPVKFAVGVTTLTNATIPKDEYYTKWVADMGFDEAIAYRDLRASYGSLMHTVIATMLIKKLCNLDLMDEVVANYCRVNSIVCNQQAWADDLRQDVLSFAQFVRDYNVRVKAIELSLVAPRLGLAGTLDIFCEMDYTEKGYYGETYASGANKGQPKETKRTVRVAAVIDNKSGRKTTGGVHNGAQLTALRMLLKENYPQYADVPIRLYNWHPKDWRSAPAYLLVDQTFTVSEAVVHNCLGNYAELYPAVEEKKRLEMFGVVQLETDGEEETTNYATPAVLALVQQAVNNGDITQQHYDLTDDFYNENNNEDAEKQDNAG